MLKQHETTRWSKMIDKRKGAGVRFHTIYDTVCTMRLASASASMCICISVFALFTSVDDDYLIHRFIDWFIDSLNDQFIHSFIYQSIDRLALFRIYMYNIYMTISYSICHYLVSIYVWVARTVWVWLCMYEIAILIFVFVIVYHRNLRRRSPWFDATIHFNDETRGHARAIERSRRRVSSTTNVTFLVDSAYWSSQ